MISGLPAERSHSCVDAISRSDSDFIQSVPLLAQGRRDSCWVRVADRFTQRLLSCLGTVKCRHCVMELPHALLLVAHPHLLSKAPV